MVGAIVPWNYPLLLLSWKLAPALAAGNPVVARPSELRPISTLMLAAMRRPPAGGNGVPPGRRRRRRRRDVRDERVDCVASRAGGARRADRREMRRARGPDGPGDGQQGPVHRVRRFPQGRFTGRPRRRVGCLPRRGSGLRLGRALLRATPGFDDFVSAFIDHTRTLRVGDPLDPSTDMGPMASAPQRAKIEAQMEAAVDAGAELVVGGDRAGRDMGRFFSPAVVTGAPAESDLLREETFGPVAPTCRSARWTRRSS